MHAEHMCDDRPQHSASRCYPARHIYARTVHARPLNIDASTVSYLPVTGQYCHWYAPPLSCVRGVLPAVKERVHSYAQAKRVSGFDRANMFFVSVSVRRCIDSGCTRAPWICIMKPVASISFSLIVPTACISRRYQATTYPGKCFFKLY